MRFSVIGLWHIITVLLPLCTAATGIMQKQVCLMYPLRINSSLKSMKLVWYQFSTIRHEISNFSSRHPSGFRQV